MEKKCSKCGETKDVSEFSKNNQKKDGYMSTCKKCRSIYRKGIYAESPELKLRNRAKAKKWRIENPERYKYNQDKYRIENEAELKEKKSIYQKENWNDRKKYHKEWSNKNYKHVRSYCKKQLSVGRTNLHDWYLRFIIKQNSGLTDETIKNHPELIENKRLGIKIKRILKQKKYENTETC